MTVALTWHLVRNRSRRTTRVRSWRVEPPSPAGHIKMAYTVILTPSAARTRVLVLTGQDELLRAFLPPPAQVQYERAVIAWLESLALWLNTKLHVVLSVDVKEAGLCLGLTDELGVGVRSLFFDVEVRHRAARRRRGQRIRGIGDFSSDLRQLRLVPDDN